MKNKRIGTVIVISVGVILIILGVITREYDAVLEKSVRICMECIGIG